jgi:hypothetical protein
MDLTQLPLTKDGTQSVCVEDSSRRDPYYSYHETLIRFQDVPEIVRDENKSYHTQKWEQ